MVYNDKLFKLIATLVNKTTANIFFFRGNPGVIFTIDDNFFNKTLLVITTFKNVTDGILEAVVSMVSTVGLDEQTKNV